MIRQFSKKSGFIEIIFIMKGVKIVENPPVQFGEAQTHCTCVGKASFKQLQRKVLFGDRLLR